MRLVDGDALSQEAGKLWSEMPDGEELSKELMKAINHAPTIDAVPVKHGRWEYSENIYDESTWACSICKEPWTLIDGTPKENDMMYCPNCGAKMDLEG